MIFFIPISRETAEWWADAFTGFRFRDILPFYFDKSNSWGVRIVLAMYFISLAAIMVFCSYELVRITLSILGAP